MAAAYSYEPNYLHPKTLKTAVDFPTVDGPTMGDI